MIHKLRLFRSRFLIFFPFLALGFQPGSTWAQFAESTIKENSLLTHGIEQYEQKHYNLAVNTLNEFLKQDHNFPSIQPSGIADADYQKGKFYYILSLVKNNNKEGIETAESLLSTLRNPYYRSQAAFSIGQYYFKKNQLQDAIQYYEQADIDYLSNEDIADLKFELAYSYFNNQQFNQAKPLFAAIKELPSNKYYIPGNYYYGLLAYKDKNYEQALKSFKRINNEPKYLEVVPYYEAEIYYFLKDYNQVLSISKKYLKQGKLHYSLAMKLLTAQALFEQKKYSEALPYFEEYYEQTDKIRKEELYELAYTYYQLKKWDKAILRFQPLSSAQDSLGQTAMYLLGDCYLKTSDKQGAKNAFELCANMDFNPGQKEASSFISSKLSAEMGNEPLAMQGLSQFVKNYPKSIFADEAKTILSQLLAKGNNYTDAYHLIEDMGLNDLSSQSLFQKVSLGYALQLIQNNQLQNADKVLDKSLKYPVDKAYESVTLFWKGEVAYRLGDYQNAINNSKIFLNKSNYVSSYALSGISPNATTSNAQMIIGYAQMKLGDYSNAQSAFAQAVNASKDNPQMLAEANLQEADAYFMQQQMAQAKTLYQKAIDSKTEHKDYALYQLAIVNGLMGDTASKIQCLNQLIKQNTSSYYHAEALYELALIKLNAGNTEGVINDLNELITSSQTPEQMKAKATFQLANSYRLNNNNEKALDYYSKFLRQYPTDTAYDIAMDIVRELYIADGNPEAYLTFIKNNNLPNPNEETLENTFYDAAIKHYSDENWTKSISSFSKYLEQFPKGKNALKAYYYRGNSYVNNKENDKAIEDFNAVMKYEWSDFYNDAAAEAARLSVGKKDFEKAYQYYSLLRDAGTQNQELLTAYEGLVKSSFELGKYNACLGYCDTLSTLPGLSPNLKSQCQLYKAKSFQLLKKYDDALPIFQNLDKENIGVISAEARYRIAEIAFDKGANEEAENLAGYAAQTSAGHDYWIVKCYILLGDILTKEGDYFNAKATLSSIISNTKIEDLKEEATEKLEQVKALEKKNQKLSED